MRPAEIFRTATFRTAALAAAGFGGSTLLLFGFIYWQTAVRQTERFDKFLRHELAAIASGSPDEVTETVRVRYAKELRRINFAGVFSPAQDVLAGNMLAYPQDLTPDGAPHPVRGLVQGADGKGVEPLRVIGRRLADGRILLVGRSQRQLVELRTSVLRALGLGLPPALLSALLIGYSASRRALNRVQMVNRGVTRIMQGHFGERLTGDTGDDALNQLAASVNRMLDDIEHLLGEMRGLGDDIAHDLRTPLTRLRTRLERGRGRATSLEELGAVVDQGIADLDQAFALITALLRIGQIEASARREGFAHVDLNAIAGEAAELYQPMAELRGVTLSCELGPDVAVWGDRDLLFDVAANLLDNAVKFTPSGGRVVLRTFQGQAGAVLQVRDTGPGIPAAERAAVLKRFHRGDRSRHVPGHGLGLSLVAAIVRLHMFHLVMGDAAPGLVVEMRGWAEV